MYYTLQNQQNSRCVCWKQQANCFTCSNRPYSSFSDVQAPSSGITTLTSLHTLQSEPEIPLPAVMTGGITRVNNYSTLNNHHLNQGMLPGSTLGYYSSQNLQQSNGTQEMIASKNTELLKNMNEFESFTFQQEQILQNNLNVNINQSLQEVDNFYQNLDTLLKNQKEALKNEIRQRGQNSTDIPEKKNALEQISNSKALLTNIDSRTSPGIILLRLNQEEESFKKLDVSNLKLRIQKDVVEKSQIQLQYNQKLIDKLQKTHIVSINPPDSHSPTPNNPGNPYKQGKSQKPQNQQSQNSQTRKAHSSNFQSHTPSEKKQYHHSKNGASIQNTHQVKGSKKVILHLNL